MRSDKVADGDCDCDYYDDSVRDSFIVVFFVLTLPFTEVIRLMNHQPARPAKRYPWSVHREKLRLLLFYRFDVHTNIIVYSLLSSFAFFYTVQIPAPPASHLSTARLYKQLATICSTAYCIVCAAVAVAAARIFCC
jgi:hypothetical protein